MQHVFKSDYTAEVRYVGTRGEDLDAQNSIDFQRCCDPDSHHLPTYLQDPGQATLDGLPFTLGALLDRAKCRRITSRHAYPERRIRQSDHGSCPGLPPPTTDCRPN